MLNGRLREVFQKGPGRANILGVEVDLVTRSETAAAMELAIQNRTSFTVSFVNAHMVITAREDSELREALNGCSLAVPDGMPLVWLSRWTDRPLSQRVDGFGMFRHFCALSEVKGYSHFFYGSSPAVLEPMTRELGQSFPRLKTAGSISPPYRPLTPAEETRHLELINESGADVLWVGLGCPKQEKWIYRVRNRVSVPVIAGIGAVFEFQAGTVKRAPACLQNCGLEWLFRLIMEPRRLWKRYLVGNLQFVYWICREIVGYCMASKKRKRHTTGGVTK